MSSPPADVPGVAVSPALLKATGSTALGAMCGSAAHEAMRSFFPPAHALVDVSLNVADVGCATLAGGIIGLIWATESALVKSGVITATLQTVTATIKLEAGDQAAGASLAEALRSIDGITGWLVRTACIWTD